MTLAHHVTVLSAGHLQHIDLSISYCYIWPDFLTVPYPAPSVWFPGCAMSIFPNLHYVHQAWVESYAVGGIDECSMTVIIHPGSHCALTATSVSPMTSLIEILLVNVISILVFAFSLNRNSQDNISLLVIYQPDLVSESFAWPVRALHQQRRIIMSHNLVTEIQKILTLSKIGTRFAFQGDMSSKLTIRLSIPPATQEPSRILGAKPISVWLLTRDEICRGKSLQVQQCLIS